LMQDLRFSRRWRLRSMSGHGRHHQGSDRDELHSNNMDNEEGFSLRKSWKPLFKKNRRNERKKWVIAFVFDHPRISPFQGQHTPSTLLRAWYTI
jgi:hypothetical protein